MTTWNWRFFVITPDGSEITVAIKEYKKPLLSSIWKSMLQGQTAGSMLTTMGRRPVAGIRCVVVPK